jgi:hypothetical protein
MVLACAHHCPGIATSTVLDTDSAPATPTAEFQSPEIASLTFEATVDRWAADRRRESVDRRC